MRQRIYRLLEGPADTAAARWVRGAIQALILINVIAVAAGTVRSIQAAYGPALLWIEHVSVAVFSVEYLLRIYSCTVDPRYSRPIVGRLRFAVSPYALIDLVAIAPAYLPMVGLDLRSLRIVRLLRVFRVLKLGRYSKAIHSLGQALKDTAPQIAICALGMLVLLDIGATVLYYAERGAQPEVFTSIPAAGWWAITALTTVGYGDVVPITPIGKVAASIVSVLGLGLFALPAGIWASAFISQFREPSKCPHCGEDVRS